MKTVLIGGRKMYITKNGVRVGNQKAPIAKTQTDLGYTLAEMTKSDRRKLRRALREQGHGGLAASRPLKYES